MWPNRPGLWALGRRYTCLPNLKSYRGNGGSISGLWLLSSASKATMYSYHSSRLTTHAPTPTYTPKPKHPCLHCFPGACTAWHLDPHMLYFNGCFYSVYPCACIRPHKLPISGLPDIMHGFLTEPRQLFIFHGRTVM